MRDKTYEADSVWFSYTSAIYYCIMLLSGQMTLREEGCLTLKHVCVRVCARACVCEGPSAPCLLSAVIECVLKLSIFGDYLILAAGD